jgi:hypothetical protein
MEKEPKGVAQNATAENEVVANAKTPPALFGAANGGDTTGETEGLSELALAGGVTTNGQTTATGTPPPAGAREEDELARVQLTSSKDNAFHASRWENTDGTTTKYAETFKEKIKIELKREFGKDVTHAEVLKMIEDAKKAKDETKAEDYRKKLFRANQYAIVETLNVDQTTDDGKVHGQNALGQDFSTTQNHEMYGRIKGSTYCNIYAYDVVTAMGAYVPRCWWTSKFEKEALEAMEAKKPYTTVPKYGTNVSEMNANALNSWFDRIGKYFGWRKAASMEEGQLAANNGNVVVLQAANKEASKSGHIAVILAERDDHKASRVKDKVDVPLTSQAGSVNHKYKTGSKWWENSDHKNGAAWIHDGAMDSPLLKPEEIGVEGAPAAATTAAPTGGVKAGENTPKPEVKPAVQPVNNAQTKDNKPAAQTGANPNGTLTLKKFELTVQGEGADGATKYIEWPNTSASGVTLGKGYDIGSRSAKQVIDELTTSGMSKVQAEKISKGVGLKGQAAGDWVKANKKDVGEIALDVQYKLLDLVMPKFTAQAKDVATNTKAQKDSGGNYTNAAGREKGDGVKAGTYVMSGEQWDGLHPAMVEFITDLKYQGGYYLYDRIEKINSALIKHHGNHLEQFKAVAALFESAKAGELSYMDNYGKGIGEGTGNKELFYGMTKEQLANASTRRNRIRLAFLKHIIAALEAGKTVSYGPIEKVDPTPATKPVTTPVKESTTTGGSPAQPVAEVPVKETPAKEAATGGESATKDDKNITISRGVLQMTSEGSFEGNSSDVRTPHFPENLAIYTPIAAGETIAAKDRYDVTGDRAKKAASGAYKRKTLLNRHEVADYDTKVSGADKIATGPNNSGVTIGFGYDIGAAWNTTDKEKCKKDLKAAGISEENAEALSAAVGLRTMAAGRKTAELRKTVKITADQAVNLLGVVMGRYDANYTKGVVHPAIEEAFSYVNYWKGNGGGKAFVSKMFEAAKDKKGVDQFTAVISVIDTEGWGGGFDVIKNFLKVIKGKIQDGNDVSFVTKTSLDGLLNGDNDTFDIVKESAKGTHIGKKDYYEQLTGKPKANTGGTTTTGTKDAKPATPAAESAPSLIKDTVGSGGKNNGADVRVVKQCLYNSGLDLTVNDVADKQLTDAIMAFQKAHFSWTPDGLISPGKATAKKLAEFKDKARPAAQPAAKPAAVAQESPTQRMEKEYKKYSDGQIDMVGLAKAMKTYAVSSPATVIALISKLGYTETDNFAYAFASHSTDAELSSYDRALLKRLSDDLDAYLTMSRTANLGQKARIDKAISKPLVIPAAKPATGGETAAKPVAKPEVKPVAKPVASEQQAQSASTATGSTRTPVTISKSVGVGGVNNADDLKKIQDLLKDIGFRLGSGKLQKNTNGAIAAFQVANGLGSDGRVDPGGKTLETLNNTPSGAFKNTAKQLAEDNNAPNLSHSKWTNRAHFATDTAGEIIPRQFYGNMNTLIKYMEIIADNLKGTFNVNCGYRSPHHNANTEGSAERSNHQFGRAVDIKPSDYTPKQFAAELRRLIKEGKIHAGGIGTYGTFVHYDIDSSREWNG